MPPSTQTCLGQWAEDARLFASRPGEDNETALTLIVADFEYSYDRDRHTGYKIAEGKAAEPKIRWCLHRIAAVSWMILRFVPGKTVPEIEEPVAVVLETSAEKAASPEPARKAGRVRRGRRTGRRRVRRGARGGAPRHRAAAPKSVREPVAVEAVEPAGSENLYLACRESTRSLQEQAVAGCLDLNAFVGLGNVHLELLSNYCWG